MEENLYKTPWRVHTIGGITDLLDCDHCIIATGSGPLVEYLYNLVSLVVNGDVKIG